MKFIVKSDEADKGKVSFINANSIESIVLNVKSLQSIKQINGKRTRETELIFYYSLRMISEGIQRFFITDETDIKEVESLLLESGITSEKIEGLKRRVASRYNRDRI